MNVWVWWPLRILLRVLTLPLVAGLLPVAFFCGFIAEGPESAVDYAASVLSWWLE